MADLKASTASSPDWNHWPRRLFLILGNVKKSLGLRSGLYGGWSRISTFSCFKYSIVWRALYELALSWCRMMRRFELDFRSSAMTCGKQTVVYHSALTVLRSSSAIVATWPVFSNERGHHLLWSASRTNNFSRLWLVLKDPDCRLLFGIRIVGIDPRFVTTDDVVDVIWLSSVEPLQSFLTPSDAGRLVIVGKQMRYPTAN